MPVLIATVVAAVVVAIVLGLTTRSHHPAPAGAHVEQLLVTKSEQHPRFRQFLLERRDPKKATGLALTIALGLAALTTLAIGLLLEMVQTHQGFARWDTAAARWGAGHAHGITKTILLRITTIGSTPFVIGVVVIVGLIEMRRLHTRAAPLFLGTVVAAELILNNLVKVIVTRDRPDINRLVHASGYSFPSGHTAATAATYAAVALLLGIGRSRRTKTLLASAAGALTVIVAASRVLLGAHWLTDVFAGAALGLGVFALCSIAYGGRLLHFGEPVEEAQYEVAVEAHTSDPAHASDTEHASTSTR